MLAPNPRRGTEIEGKNFVQFRYVISNRKIMAKMRRKYVSLFLLANRSTDLIVYHLFIHVLLFTKCRTAAEMNFIVVNPTNFYDLKLFLRLYDIVDAGATAGAAAAGIGITIICTYFVLMK